MEVDLAPDAAPPGVQTCRCGAHRKDDLDGWATACGGFPRALARALASIVGAVRRTRWICPICLQYLTRPVRRAKTAVRAVVRVGPPALIVQVPNGCPPLPARPCPCPSSSSLPRRRTVKTADNIVAPSPTASSTTTRLTSRFATKTASRAAPPIGADGSPSCPVARLPSQRPSATHAQHTSAVAAAAAALRRALLCERWPAAVALDSYLVPVSRCRAARVLVKR